MTRALAILVVRILLWPVFALSVGLVLLSCHLIDWMLWQNDRLANPPGRE